MLLVSFGVDVHKSQTTSGKTLKNQFPSYLFFFSSRCVYFVSIKANFQVGLVSSVLKLENLFLLLWNVEMEVFP